MYVYVYACKVEKLKYMSWFILGRSLLHMHDCDIQSMKNCIPVSMVTCYAWICLHLYVYMHIYACRYILYINPPHKLHGMYMYTISAHRQHYHAVWTIWLISASGETNAHALSVPWQQAPCVGSTEWLHRAAMMKWLCTASMISIK